MLACACAHVHWHEHTRTCADKRNRTCTHMCNVWASMWQGVTSRLGAVSASCACERDSLSQQGS
eukprot:12053109-Alexandrium_andersonii.AAC.1